MTTRSMHEGCAPPFGCGEACPYYRGKLEASIARHPAGKFRPPAPAVSESSALVTDTFHYPCWGCGQAIEIVGGQRQPHECATYDTEQERICAAYWAGYDRAGRDRR